MPRYLIERILGAITDDELQAAADRTTRVRVDDFPGVVWEHTHVVRADGGLTAFCVYSAPDPETIRDLSQAAGIPADRIYEIHSDIVPHGPG
jgi:hypothetical protein